MNKASKKQSIVQQCLGAEKWKKLPKTLQKHHGSDAHVENGYLCIRFPNMMKLPLFILALMGVLIGKQKEKVPTTVSIGETDQKQEWARRIDMTDSAKSKIIKFNSTWIYLEKNQFIEYVTPFMGLVMFCDLQDDVLHIDGVHYLLDLKLFKIKLPENLLFGHSTIREKQINEEEYEMDFRLNHPWFGQVYQYTGRFSTLALDETLDVSI